MDPQSYLAFLGVISPNVRESKTVLDSRFHAMESGIYGVESRIQNCWIPEFTAKISTVPLRGASHLTTIWTNIIIYKELLKLAMKLILPPGHVIP